MKGFYSNIQSWMKQDNSGRYVANILALTLESDKKFAAAFAKIFDAKVNNRTFIVTEKCFGDKSKRADLAFVDGEDIVALVEIKWDDKLKKADSDGEHGQLEDYLAYSRKNKIPFLILTKDKLLGEEHDSLKRHDKFAKHLYFENLALIFSSSDSAISKMAEEYLNEKGIFMNNVDQDMLYSFLTRVFNPYHGSGRKDSEEIRVLGPEQLSTIMKNLRLIERDVTQFLGVERGLGRNKQPNIDYRFLHRFDQNYFNKVLNDSDDELWIGHSGKLKSGGKLFVYATSYIQDKGAKYLSIEYGFSFGVSTTAEKNITVHAFSHVYRSGSGNWNDHSYKENRINKSFNSKNVIFSKDKKQDHIHALINIINLSISDVLKDPDLDNQHRDTLVSIAKRFHK